MSDPAADPRPDHPQLYLISPPVFDPQAFAPQLARILDAIPVACLRLSLASSDEDAIARAADALRGVAHERDIAIVIDRHAMLAERLGLDGVHLPVGMRGVRKLRETMGAEAIIGAGCGTSRHDGMSAAEAGADYVSFAPLGATPLGDGETVDHEIFAWWSEVIEVPVVAEGALTPDLIAQFAPVTDFFAIGDEIWGAEDPLAALKTLIAPIGL